MGLGKVAAKCLKKTETIHHQTSQLNKRNDNKHEVAAVKEESCC